MSKKFLLAAGLICSLKAYTTFYTYTVKMDYREYQNGVVIDRDYTKLGKMLGIGILYKNNEYSAFRFYIKGEYAAGNSIYDGETWGGTPLNNLQKNTYIYNIEGGVGLHGTYFILGYRFWDRGKSDYPGDYDEQYYWPYIGIKYTFVLGNSQMALIPSISYESAINPKLKAQLYGGITYDLGATNGLNLELPFYYRINDFLLKVYYRYQYWHILPSDIVPIVTNSGVIYTQEPESKTRNQYFGLGVVYNF
jgi:hypothetical protein